MRLAVDAGITVACEPFGVLANGTIPLLLKSLTHTSAVGAFTELQLTVMLHEISPGAIVQGFGEPEIDPEGGGGGFPRTSTVLKVWLPTFKWNLDPAAVIQVAACAPLWPLANCCAPLLFRSVTQTLALELLLFQLTVVAQVVLPMAIVQGLGVAVTVPVGAGGAVTVTVIVLDWTVYS
jgi:hypothetical protein